MDAQRPCQDLPSSNKAIIYEFTNHFYLVTPVAMQFTHKTVNPSYHHLSWNSSGKSLFNEIISLIQPLLFKVVYVHRSSFSEIIFLFDIQKLFLQCIWCNYAALLLRKIHSSLTGGIALPFQNLFFLIYDWSWSYQSFQSKTLPARFNRSFSSQTRFLWNQLLLSTSRPFQIYFLLFVVF